MAVLTVSQIINIAKISQYLAANDVANGSLFGTRLIPASSKILYMERKAVEWLYDLDPTDTTLTKTAKYLYSLCRGYNLQAQSISVVSSGAVSVVTGQSGFIYNEIKVTVDVGSGPVSGATTYTHADLVGGTDCNYILMDKMTLFVGDDYNFDSATGTITLLLGNVWVTGSVIIIPYNQAI